MAQATAAPAPTSRPKPARLPNDSMELARKYTGWFYTNQADSIVAHLDSALRGKADEQAQYESLPPTWRAELAPR